jgi:hypothetical protein
MRRYIVAVLALSVLSLWVSRASAELAGIACSGDFGKGRTCPFAGSDFAAPTANQKHAPPEVIAKNYCDAWWQKAGKPSGTPKGTVMATKAGPCCGYALIRIDCN